MLKAVIAAATIALLLSAGVYAATVVTELHPYTETVTVRVKNQTQVFTVRGTITDQDTLPDPTTVTVRETVTETVGTTTAPPTTTTTPPPPPPGDVTLSPVEPNPLSSDPNWFPVGTWGSYNTFQGNRDLDASIGINTYVWLADPCGLGTQVMADTRFKILYDESENRSCVGRSEGWMIGDEVDMTCGPPCNGYAILDQRNASLPADGKPRYTNYGKGVMFWQNDQDAARFVNLPYLGLVSNDIYWFTDPNERNRPGYGVAASYGDKTMARMRYLDGLDGARKNIWNFVEAGWPFTESAAAGGRSITPAEMKAAVWHSLIGQARGIIYFQHSFGGPCVGDHHVLRSNCEGTRAMATEVNAMVKSIAPALNGPVVSSGFSGSPSVKSLAKWDGSNFYVLAGSAANTSSFASFSLPCVGDAVATVLGEGRTLPVTAGAWSDNFANGNAVHVYRIDGGSRCGL
jgi:hypothetical protein